MDQKKSFPGNEKKKKKKYRKSADKQNTQKLRNETAGRVSMNENI